MRSVHVSGLHGPLCALCLQYIQRKCFMNETILNHAELDAQFRPLRGLSWTCAWDRFWESNWPSRGWHCASPATPRDLIVVVENDRCIADAIQTLTGTRMGRRTFKLKDYGRMAATFINTAAQRVFRVHTAFTGTVDREDEKAVRAVLHLPDEQVVAWQEVKVHLRPRKCREDRSGWWTASDVGKGFSTARIT